MHYPVLLRESLEFLAIRPGGTYLDCTAGLGGHTGAIAARLESGRVIAADRDSDSIEMARRNTAAHAQRILFRHAAFSGLRAALQELGIERVDGLVADLGVSRFQLTEPSRGFSLMQEGPVDMRMDRTQGQTAADLVNYLPERALSDLIFRLGEERRARSIARAIVRARPIRSTAHLAQVIERVAHRTGRIHPATRTFMALRIAVNEELTELESLLEAVPELVRPGGRAVVITFMSIEDRIVKHAFRALAGEGRATILTKHVVTPADEEIRENPASRSAKLRALEMR